MKINEQTTDQSLNVTNIDLIPFKKSEGGDFNTDEKDNKFKNVDLDYSWKQYNAHKIKKFQDNINNGVSDSITIYGTPKRSSVGLFLNHRLFVSYNENKNIKMVLSKKNKPDIKKENIPVDIPNPHYITISKNNKLDIKLDNIQAGNPKSKDLIKNEKNKIDNPKKQSDNVDKEDPLLPYFVLHPELLPSSHSECVNLEEPKVELNNNTISDNSIDSVEKGESDSNDDSGANDKNKEIIVNNSIKANEIQESVDFNSEMEYEYDHPSKMMSREEVQELIRKRTAEKEREKELERERLRNHNKQDMNQNDNSGIINHMEKDKQNIIQNVDRIKKDDVLNNKSLNENIEQNNKNNIDKVEINAKDSKVSNININMNIEIDSSVINNNAISKNNNMTNNNVNILNNTSNLGNKKKELSFTECMRLMDNSKVNPHNQNNLLIQKDDLNLSSNNNIVNANNINNTNDIVDLELKDIDDGIVEMKEESKNSERKENYKRLSKRININKDGIIGEPISFLDLVKNNEMGNVNDVSYNKSMNEFAHRNLLTDNNFDNEETDIVNLNKFDQREMDVQDEELYDINIENELKEYRKSNDLEIYKDTLHIDHIMRKKYIEQFDLNDTFDFDQIEKHIVKDVVFYYKDKTIEKEDFKIKKLDYKLEKKKRKKSGDQ